MVVGSGEYFFICITGLFTLLHLGYLVYLSANKVERHKDTSIINNKAVSVIICARNEAQNLEQFLPKILQQDFPEFEVIVMDDFSEDITPEIILGLQKKYSNLYYHHVTGISKVTAGKRKALHEGILHAKYNTIVVTDADCYPSSIQWLQKIASPILEEKTHITIGYSFASKQAPYIEQLDKLNTNFLFIGFAQKGEAYMGVGRNMAFRKSDYLQLYPEVPHYVFASGDDDMFIQEALKKNKAIMPVTDFDAFITTKGTGGVLDWVYQKSRHLQTASAYRIQDQIKLFIYYFSECVAYYVPLLLAFFWQQYLFIFIPILIISIKIRIFKRFLQGWGIIYTGILGILQLTYPLALIIAHLNRALSSKIVWKKIPIRQVKQNAT